MRAALSTQQAQQDAQVRDLQAKYTLHRHSLRVPGCLTHCTRLASIEKEQEELLMVLANYEVENNQLRAMLGAHTTPLPATPAHQQPLTPHAQQTQHAHRSPQPSDTPLRSAGGVPPSFASPFSPPRFEYGPGGLPASTPGATSRSPAPAPHGGSVLPSYEPPM